MWRFSRFDVTHPEGPFLPDTTHIRNTHFKPIQKVANFDIFEVMNVRNADQRLNNFPKHSIAKSHAYASLMLH